MAIITENGSGLPNANSYATVAAFKLYQADRGEDLSDYETAQLSAALVKATDCIDSTYRANGLPLLANQALQWPREGDYGLDGRVVRATMILALAALSGPLQARVERNVKLSKVSLDGGGSVETAYEDGSPADAFPHVTAILSPIASLRSDTGTGGNGVMISRVVR